MDAANSGHLSMGPWNYVTEVVRQGKRQMLAKAIENKVGEYPAAGEGHLLVVPDGHLPERSIQHGLGGGAIRQACASAAAETSMAGVWSKIICKWLGNVAEQFYLGNSGLYARFTNANGWFLFAETSFILVFITKISQKSQELCSIMELNNGWT